MVTVTVEDNNENFVGRLILVQEENEETHEPKSLVIATEEGIKSVSVKKIKVLKIHDEKLVKEFQKSIFNYTWDKDKEREVIISFTPQPDTEKTKIFIGYLIQMPVWKISYRLRVQSEEDIRISGWVIVENESNEDWNQMDLQLISGNPISFIYDQETFVQLTRSDFTPAPPKAAGPVIAQATLGSENDEYASGSGGGLEFSKRSMARKAGLMAAAAPAPPPGMPMSAPKPMMKEQWLGDVAAEPEMYFDAEKRDELMSQMVDAIQETDKDIKTGSDYYVYTKKSKITIPSKEKSLIPLINEQIKAKKILYHKNTMINPSPYQAIELTNNTDFPFEHGPVMIFSESNPIGQSILEKTNIGQSRVLSYALEDRLRIYYKSEITNYSEYTYGFYPEKKLLIQRRFKYEKIEIRIINFLNEPSKLIIDYYPEEELELEKDLLSKSLEVTKEENHYRVKLDPVQKSIEKYSLQFRKELVTNVSFESLDKKLVLNISPENLNESMKSSLISFIETQDKLRQLTNELSTLRSRMNSITNDEDRIQKNIMSLSNRKEDERTRNTFIQKLEDLFEDYLQLQSQEEEIKSQQKDLHNKLESLLGEMKDQTNK